MYFIASLLAPVVREGRHFNSTALDQPTISVQHYLLELQEKKHSFHMMQHSDSSLQPQHTYFLKGNVAFIRMNSNDFEYKEVEKMKAVCLSSQTGKPTLSSKPKC